ncbi:hypothetical protein Pmani_009402 [Petrolisthes manimaculis]|uniref:Uncharacterized protein n=1 Tax=Petrolisthes manimaculis TaxID=1843537 RepID=A0AAE1Q3K4_9EUCA|nr:hypothetical protein Pmani_009402 [Petrolisthes manimaculis]
MVLVCEEGKEVGAGVGVNQACMREQEHEQARAVAVACLVGCQGQLGIASQPHRPRKLYLHLSPSFHPFPTPAHLPSSQKTLNLLNLATKMKNCQLVQTNKIEKYTKQS